MTVKLHFRFIMPWKVKKYAKHDFNFSMYKIGFYGALLRQV